MSDGEGHAGLYACVFALMALSVALALVVANIRGWLAGIVTGALIATARLART